MPQYAAAVRDEKTQEAVALRARQWSWRKIGEEIGVTHGTVKTWVENEYARRAEHRDIDREAHLAVYDEIQREAWEWVNNPKLNVNARIGYLNTIKAAEDSKLRITGAEAPVKHDFRNVTEYEVTWDDLDADLEATEAN